MNIGIIRLGSLGDIIHTLPALSALRTKFPRIENGTGVSNRIDWLTESAYIPFLQGHPCLDGVQAVDTKRWRRIDRGTTGPLQAFRRIRDRHYDAVIDFQGLLKSAVVSWLTGARRRIGFDAPHCREILAASFYTERVPLFAKDSHVIEWNLSLLTPLGLKGDIPIEFPIGLTAIDRENADRFYDGRRKDAEFPPIAIHPGAGWATKRWSVENYAALGTSLARETGARLLVIWGPGEDSLAASLCEKLDDSAEVIPPTTVREMAGFLERCGLVIGGDTGPLHLAAALGVPTLALMGPTTPARNGPMGPGGVRGTIVHHELSCSHCYQRVCPGFGTRCLTGMSPEEVAGAALDSWSRSRSVAAQRENQQP